MTKPTIRIHNTETDEIIDREMTDAEFKAHQEFQAEIASIEAIKVEKESAKEIAQAKLVALGITIEDLQALGL